MIKKQDLPNTKIRKFHVIYTENIRNHLKFSKFTSMSSIIKRKLQFSMQMMNMEYPTHICGTQRQMKLQQTRSLLLYFLLLLRNSQVCANPKREFAGVVS